MLNLGIIGDINLLIPYLEQIHHFPEIHISGKSSTGSSSWLADFKALPPEFNRVELIERSDALMINHSSLIPFEMLCAMVKKSKHIFFAEYPDLSQDKCQELAKLASEARTILQVTNPFSGMPPVEWMARNLKKPAFIEISFFKDKPVDQPPLLSLLMMLKTLTGLTPRKTGAIAFHSAPAKADFTHIHLEFGDASVVHLNIGPRGSTDEFLIRSWSEDQFLSLDLTARKYSCNNSKIKKIPSAGTPEIIHFAQNASGKTSNYTGIEDYSVVLQSLKKIESKLHQFRAS